MSAGTVTGTDPSVSWKPVARGWAATKQKIARLRIPSNLYQDTSLRTDVQTPSLGQIDSPDGIRDARGFLVEGPCDVVGFPDMPYGSRGGTKDLGNPDIPGSEVHRCGEDGGRSGKEESSHRGHEFHRERIGVCVKGVRGSEDGWGEMRVGGGGGNCGRNQAGFCTLELQHRNPSRPPRNTGINTEHRGGAGSRTCASFGPADTGSNVII